MRSAQRPARQSRGAPQSGIPKLPSPTGSPNASVLFADITGFVAIARTLGPEKTVAMLNLPRHRASTNWPRATALRRSRRSAMPIWSPPVFQNPAPTMLSRRLPAMALDMMRAARERLARRNSGLDDQHSRRHGQSGPMTAGVIGKRKFSAMTCGEIRSISQAALNRRASPDAFSLCPGLSRTALKASSVPNLNRHATIEIKGVGAQ